MARTKASVGAKVSSGKSNKARCSAAPTHSGGSNGEKGGRGGGSGGSGGGGNAVCPRETPRWQRPITNFFIQHDAPHETESSAGTSKPKPKRNVIESDEEEVETPKNTELDESIHLEPLTGENSHKIEEYYPKNGEKGKGVGKKTKGKENVNRERNNKREREESLEESVSKKIKI